MLEFKSEELGINRNEIEFVNPECGHMQRFEYNIPLTCQDAGCNKKPKPDVKRLFGKHNQDMRAKHYMEGSI